MDTGSRALRHSSEIDNEVANLTEKVVLIGVPVGTSVSVWVGVNDSHAGEGSSGLENRQVGSITNELRVVVLDDWLGDDIGSRGEVNDGGGCC